ncbi:hypothetical protein REPUB_Repub20aG0082000 [Reevesia pubescens]
MALNPAAKIYVPTVSTTTDTILRPVNECKLQFRCHVVKPSLLSRRQIIARTSASLVAVLIFNCGLTPLPVLAESDDQKGEDEGVVGTIKSLFDPNEKTKSGKVLPKAYLKSAREVVKTLRESLKEDPKDIAKFRRTADSAKESIRDYLSNWKGREVAREVCTILSLTACYKAQILIGGFIYIYNPVHHRNHTLSWKKQSDLWPVFTQRQVHLLHYQKRLRTKY